MTTRNIPAYELDWPAADNVGLIEAQPRGTLVSDAARMSPGYGKLVDRWKGAIFRADDAYAPVAVCDHMHRHWSAAQKCGRRLLRSRLVTEKQAAILTEGYRPVGGTAENPSLACLACEAGVCSAHRPPHELTGPYSQDGEAS